MRFGACCSCSMQRGSLGKIWGLGCAGVWGCLQERSQWYCFSCDNPEDRQAQLFVTRSLHRLLAPYVVTQTHASLLGIRQHR